MMRVTPTASLPVLRQLCVCVEAFLFSLSIPLLPIHLSLYLPRPPCLPVSPVPRPTLCLFSPRCSIPSILPSLVLSPQVFWGQEHLNCLTLVEEHLRTYLRLQREDSADGCSRSHPRHPQPPPSPGAPSPRTEHSSDDLRTGHFNYIQDSGECCYVVRADLMRR